VRTTHQRLGPRREHEAGSSVRIARTRVQSRACPARRSSSSSTTPAVMPSGAT
jgi:hypothetical protein